jgi:hypothetical protein
MASTELTDPALLKVQFEDKCIVVNDADEYYFDSAEKVSTVGLLCAFLETQEGFPPGMKALPFSSKGRKIASRDVSSSTVAFIKICAPSDGTCLLSIVCADTL